MKKFMCLMLALSIVMMTMVFVPMSASAKSFYLFDDFDDSTAIDANKWVGRYFTESNRPEFISIVENSTFDTGATGKSVMLTGTTYNWFGTELDEAITSGVLNINFDVWVPTDYTQEVKLHLYNKDNTEVQISNITNKYVANNGKEKGNWASWAYAGDLERGAWTSVDYTLNLDTKAVTFKVAQETTGKSWTKSGTYVDADGVNTATNLSSVKAIKFSGHNSSQAVYIDNLLMTHTDHKLPIEDDFNGGAINTLLWDKITGSTTGDLPQISLSDGSLKLQDIHQNLGIGTTVAEPITDGKINLKFDVKFDENFTTKLSARSELVLYGGTGITGDNSIVWMHRDGCHISGVSSTICKPIANTWHTVNVTVDVATRETTLIMTPENGATEVQTGTCNKTAISSTSQISFGANNLNYSPKSYALIDNVSITQPVNAPKSESVTFVKYDDTTSTALTNVSAGTKEIVVGFSADVDNSTLNDDTVTLVNKTTNTTVDYTGKYNATAKTWTIPLGTDYLDPSATYELTVTSAVQNGDGESAPLYRYAFTTDEGEYKVTSITAYKGDTVVDKWADLEDGDTITVKANVINTTGADKTLLLICAGYNGDEVKACAVSNTKAVTKDQKNITVEDITLTVDKDDMTMVKLFGWDNTLDYLTTGVNVID